MSVHEWSKQVPRICHVDLHSLWIEFISGQMMLSEQHHELCRLHYPLVIVDIFCTHLNFATFFF